MEMIEVFQLLGEKDVIIFEQAKEIKKLKEHVEDLLNRKEKKENG